MVEIASPRDYLYDLHQQVGPNYTYLDTGESFECFPAAISMARHILLAERRSTSIEQLVNWDGNTTLDLVPFTPAENWYRHFVCIDPLPPDPAAEEPMVYDPIFPEPLPYTEFLAALFRNPEQIIIRDSMRYGPAP